jgi:hypothetical protein
MAVEPIPLSLIPLQEWAECPVERGTFADQVTVPGAGVDLPLPSTDDLLSPTGDQAPADGNQSASPVYGLRLRSVDGVAVVNVLFNGASVGTYFLAATANELLEIPAIAAQNTTQIRLASGGDDVEVVYEYEIPRTPISSPS